MRQSTVLLHKQYSSGRKKVSLFMRQRFLERSDKVLCRMNSD